MKLEYFSAPPAMSFDSYELGFVKLTAKAGQSLALVGVPAPPAPPAPPNATNAPTASDNDNDGLGDATSNASNANDDLSKMEHVQVASMLLGQASDYLDRMEVEYRLACRKYSSFRTKGSQHPIPIDMRRRLDGCAELCAALRTECRHVRQRIKEDREKRELTGDEEVTFEEQQKQEDAERQERSKGRRKVKQWTCDVCKVAKFADYDEACRHEENCDGTPPAEPSRPPPPTEDELSHRGSGSSSEGKRRSRSHGRTPKGRSSAANAYRSALFEKAESATASLEAQNATLENARRVMADTEATVGTITEELARNRETIESAGGRVSDLNGMTNNARRSIQTMQRRKKYLF